MTLAVSFPPGTRVLVTGATGYTGQVLTKKLASLGVTVVAIARHSSNPAPFEGLPIQWIRGDVFDPRVVDAAVAGAHYVFHVAAA